MDACIYIRGYFFDKDRPILKEYVKELKTYNVELYIENLKGMFLNASLDFVPLEIIAISFEFIKSFVFSGSYDIIKRYIINLWNLAKKEYDYVPFTIRIGGIPTENGEETIGCQFSEPLSDELKALAINRAFDLASQIEQHQFELLTKSRYYDAVGGHIFSYEKGDGSFSEIDVDKEVDRRQNGDYK